MKKYRRKVGQKKVRKEKNKNLIELVRTGNGLNNYFYNVSLYTSGLGRRGLAWAPRSWHSNNPVT